MASDLYKQIDERHTYVVRGNDEDNSLYLHINDVKSYEMLSEKEQYNLLIRIKTNNDRDALLSLVYGNSRLVISFAKNFWIFYKKETPLLDFIQEGYLGLLHAIRKYELGPKELYNEDSHSKFCTYASVWIQQYMNRYVKKTSCNVRMPEHLVTLLHKIKRYRQKFCSTYGRDPSEAEIAEHFNKDKELIHTVLDASKRPLLLSTRINSDGEDSELTIADVIVSTETLGEVTTSNANKQLRKEIFDFLLEDITQRNRLVVEMRFGIGGSEPKSLEELSDEFNVSRQRIQQIINNVTEKMKAKSEMLPKHLKDDYFHCE